MFTRCPSQIIAVVVYAQGARVSRRLELPDSPESELRVYGLTPMLLPGSLRASVPQKGRQVASITS